MSVIDLENISIENIETNNTNFMYLESFLKQEIELGFIQKIQTLNTDNFFLKIKIRQNKENKDLILGQGLATITNLKMESKPENKGFSLSLNTKLEGRQIKSIKQINLEKIILFEFQEYNLYCEFFSSNNIILTDKKNKILFCLIKEEWKDRKIKTRETYILPSSETKNILEYEINENDFDKNRNIISNIVKNINLAPILIEKYLEYKKIDKNDQTKNTFELYKTIIIDLKKYFSNIILDKTKYTQNKNKYCFFNVDIPFLDIVDSSFNKIIDEGAIKKEFFKNQNTNLNEHNKEKKHFEKILDDQNKAKDKILFKANKSKEIGDLIYNNFEYFDELKKYIKKIQTEKKDLNEIETIVKELNKKYKTNFEFKKLEKGKQKIVFLTS